MDIDCAIAAAVVCNLDLGRSLSSEELAGFAAYLAEVTEYGMETVEEVWSQWGEAIKQQVLQTLRVKIPVLFG